MSDQPENLKDGKRSIKSLFEKFAAAIAPEPDSQSDLLDVIHDAHSRKLIDAECLSMIEGVFRVYQSAVRDIMIPRTRMLTIDVSHPVESWIDDVIKYGHSRYPAVDGDPDKVVGILFAKDLIKHYENRLPVREILRPAIFIPESKRLNVLLGDLKNIRNHMAIVIDEFGSVSGLVTIEDVLEEIVGEIVDEYEDNDNDNDNDRDKGKGKDKDNDNDKDKGEGKDRDAYAPVRETAGRFRAPCVREVNVYAARGRPRSRVSA